MPGWNPYPDPPPGVPAGCEGIGRFLIGIDPGKGDESVVVTVDRYGDHGPLSPQRIGDVIAPLFEDYITGLVSRMNSSLWGVLGEIYRLRYNADHDDGDEDRRQAHDSVPMSELVDDALDDVAHHRSALGRVMLRQQAAARLRRADARETERALYRELERDRDD